MFGKLHTALQPKSWLCLPKVRGAFINDGGCLQGPRASLQDEIG